MKVFLCLKFFLKFIYVKWMRWTCSGTPFMGLIPVQLQQVTTLRTRPHTWFTALLLHLELLDSFWTRDSAFLFCTRLHKLCSPENNPSWTRRRIIQSLVFLISWEDEVESLIANPSCKDNFWVGLYFLIATSYLPKSLLLSIGIFRENRNNWILW